MDFIKKKFACVKEVLSSAFSLEHLAYTVIALVSWLLLSAILCYHQMPDDKFVVGEPASHDVKAYDNFKFEDKEATEAAKAKAAKFVPKVFTPDRTVTNRVMKSLEYTFSKIEEERLKYKDSSVDGNVKDLRKIAESRILKPEISFPVFLSRELFDDLMELSDESFNSVRISVRAVTLEVMNKGIDASEGNENLVSEESIESIRKTVESLKPPEDEESIIFSIVCSAVRPNKVLDWVAIKDQQQKKMDAVNPVTISVAKGQTIVREGEIVTPQHLEILQAMDMYSPSIFFKTSFAGCVAVLMMMLLFYFGIREFCPSLIADKRLLILMCAIMIVTALVCRISASFNDFLDMKRVFIYVAPVAAASILIQLIGGTSLSFLCTIILSMLVAMMSKSASSSFTALFTGITAVMAFSGIRRRIDMIWSTLIIVSVNMVGAWIMISFKPNAVEPIMTAVLVAGSNGFISSLVAIGGMFFVEYLFPVVSNLRLLDLASPMEPLLQELTSKAPGTHVHSVLVANLAEAGAAAIGANALLARVGAYYHDIGKSRQPSMFIENQFGAANPHDSVTSTLSKVIIISHVKQGVEMAKKYRLPDPIIDIIEQHHGTSLIRYFHSKALKVNKDVREHDFRYPGPKPQTKEAAVVMMADSIEAAVRSLKSPDGSKIEAMIDAIINGMLNDGQFNECEISFKDISKLKKVFLKSMNSLYHTRIEYPDQKKYMRK